MNKVNIFEATLRDGSYAVNFGFTAEDTARISKGLEGAGFRLIETCHGFGLNASNRGLGKSAVPDVEHIKAADSALSKAKHGVFFIPGIGEMQHIKEAADHGISFIKIGTNATETENAEPFIKYAKDLGLMVCYNLMKSYLLPPEKIAERAGWAESWGADIVELVDSAGGMFPHEVADYMKLLRERLTSASFGFHGHNNLHLALANSIEAVKNGATYVDSTLLGMGRSTGNANTEVLAFALQKLGYETGIDSFKALDVAESILQLWKGNPFDQLDILCGYASFHSTFIGKIHAAAKKFNVDPRKLLVEVSKVEKTKVTDEIAERVAAGMAGENE